MTELRTENLKLTRNFGFRDEILIPLTFTYSNKISEACY